MYHKGSFHGGINIDIDLITCEDKIVSPEMFQSYVLNWYHTHLLRPGLDRAESIIHQYLYWPGIRHASRKEATNYDTCQRTKGSYINMVIYQVGKLSKYHGINYMYI